MVLFELAKIYTDPPPLTEIVYPKLVVKPPAPVLFPEFCGQFVCDRHSETHGVVGPLGLYVFENCVIGPAGVVLSPDRQIYDAPDLLSRFWRDNILKKAANWPPNDLLGRILLGDPALEMRRIEDVTVVSLIKPGYLVYGHWLLDLLPIAWLFRKSIVSRLEPIKFLIGERTPAWARDIMATLFGLTDTDFIFINDERDVTSVKRLIQPSLVRWSPLLGPAFNDFIEDVLSICTGPAGTKEGLSKRIFISRLGVKSTAPISRVGVDIESLETVASANGIDIVHPEKMKWVDQVRMFAHAELIVGEFGSGLHNSVFASPNSTTITIGNSVMSWTQSAIAATRNHRSQYFMPSKQEQEKNRVLIHYDPEAFDACLRKVIETL